jgi:hypothetical protein
MLVIIIYTSRWFSIVYWILYKQLRTLDQIDDCSK